MKILHTADWHLNDRLGRIDRTGDLRTAVERVAAACESERVDVLIVAGDLFSEQARPEALRETIRHWQEVFAGFLSGGGTILTCTGNHDSETFCQTLRSAMELAAPAVEGTGQTVPPGRLYLAADPTLLRLASPRGFDVQFLLMPYPTATHYLKGNEAGYTGTDDKMKLLNAAFEREIERLRSHEYFRPGLPNVLIAHANVFGAVVGESLFRMNLADDVVVNCDRFAERFDYVALGHIHKEQSLGHRHIRYSGSIEAMDLGERNDRKSLTLLEIDRSGLVADPVLLPLPSTPIYELTIRDPDADLPRLKAEYEGAEADLVNLHVNYTAGLHRLEDVLRELSAIFPRWYARDWQESTRAGLTLVPGEAADARGFAETVKDYLTQELQNHSDEERTALVSLAEELMAELDAGT